MVLVLLEFIGLGYLGGERYAVVHQTFGGEAIVVWVYLLVLFVFFFDMFIVLVITLIYSNSNIHIR